MFNHPVESHEELFSEWISSNNYDVANKTVGFFARFQPEKQKIYSQNKKHFRPTDPVLIVACYQNQIYFFVWPYLQWGL